MNLARTRSGLFLTALAVAAAPACGSGNAAPDMQTIGCTNDPRAQTYMPGMQTAGSAGHWHFTLVSSAPSPPAKGTNSWVVDITDESGAPVTGATLTVTPWMPDHGHGTSVVPVITPTGESYTIDPLYLFMPGLWRVTISGQDGSVTDTGVFTFCIQG
jgi:hypothetical protein